MENEAQLSPCDMAEIVYILGPFAEAGDLLAAFVLSFLEARANLYTKGEDDRMEK